MTFRYYTRSLANSETLQIENMSNLTFERQEMNELAIATATERQLVAFAREMGLLRLQISCRDCRRTMRIVAEPSSHLGYRFRCDCGRKESLMYKTILYESKLRLSQAFLLVNAWANQLSLDQAVNNLASLVQPVSRNSISIFYTKTRMLCRM